MKVVIAGGTGFLGQPLALSLLADGHDVAILTRKAGRPGDRTAPRLVTWTPDSATGAGQADDWRLEIASADAVVNLAGASIAGRRWSTAQKQRIRDSRVRATELLGDAIRRAASPPRALVSGSAVGYYGPLGAEVVVEEHAGGSDFLAGVCKDWESAAQRCADITRVVCVRTGLVLETDGGALPRMLLPFRLGVGGRLGSGRQYWPWIHRADWVALVRWAIDTPSVEGALNATARTPVTNAEFTRALARSLGRPGWLPAPAFALRLALGEMADGLLLSGQRAVPAKAERLGFRFQHTDLDVALRSILGRPTRRRRSAL